MTITVAKNVVWIDSDDEVRLYDADSGEFQTLNESAAHIWRLVADGRPVAEIVAELGTRFGAGDEHEVDLIARDVAEFIAALRAAGLVHEASADPT
jgi:PqqD family protein of HPr-rel-A system